MGFMDIRIVFMGSPDLALPTLRALNKLFEVVGVVTQPDRPAGRGRLLASPEVKLFAEELQIPVMQPATLKADPVMDQLSIWSPDVIVVAAFGQILPSVILYFPKYGCINVHASLLPRWRGAAPIQAAILNDEKTGVTIMKMDQGLDTGAILSQESVIIQEDMTAGALSDRLANLGAELLISTLPQYIQGKIDPIPQDDEKATFAPSLKKQDGQLDFSQPAAYLARMVRAYHPWPGTFTFFDQTRLKIFKVSSIKEYNTKPGERLVYQGWPAIGTSDGMLVLNEVQIAGKNRIGGRAFLRGVNNWVEI